MHTHTHTHTHTLVKAQIEPNISIETNIYKKRPQKETYWLFFSCTYLLRYTPTKESTASLCKTLQQHIVTHCDTQQHTPIKESTASLTLLRRQQHTATTHYNNTLQQHTARHCNNTLQFTATLPLTTPTSPTIYVYIYLYTYIWI